MIEIVMHHSYGGFKISKEMGEWLIANRGWEVKIWQEHCKSSSHPINVLYVDEGYALKVDSYFHPNQDSIEFRTNKDIIESIKAVKAAKDSEEYDRYEYHSKLYIEDLETLIWIESYNDGHERIASNRY